MSPGSCAASLPIPISCAAFPRPEGRRGGGQPWNRKIAEVTALVVRLLRDLGPSPSSSPPWAATAARRQRDRTEVLASLGITETDVGAPIVSSMDVVELGHLADGSRRLTGTGAPMRPGRRSSSDASSRTPRFEDGSRAA